MIKDKRFSEQSALFARFSNLAYHEPDVAKKLFNKMGYTSTFYSKDGSNAYVLEDKEDIIIAVRGTEVTEWSDISADLSINLVPSGTGKIHVGFRDYTNKIWTPIRDHIAKVAGKKTLWVTGHSLGAASATLMARRCFVESDLITPAALFTYGSPRVGNRDYVQAMDSQFVHHRWVNDGDIISKIPFPPLYWHCGIKHHIGSSGIITTHIENKTKIMNIIKLCMSFGTGLIKKIMGDAKDHSSALYVQHLTFWAMNDVDE